MPARTGETVLVADANEKQQGAEETEQTRGFKRTAAGGSEGHPLQTFTAPPDAGRREKRSVCQTKSSFFHFFL